MSLGTSYTALRYEPVYPPNFRPHPEEFYRLVPRDFMGGIKYEFVGDVVNVYTAPQYDGEYQLVGSLPASLYK